MQYEKQSMEVTSNGHDLELDICVPVVKGQSMIDIRCITCGTAAHATANDGMDNIEFLGLMEMEMYLHAEGFDTEWESYIDWPS